MTFQFSCFVFFYLFALFLNIINCEFNSRCWNLWIKNLFCSTQTNTFWAIAKNDSILSCLKCLEAEKFKNFASLHLVCPFLRILPLLPMFTSLTTPQPHWLSTHDDCCLLAQHFSFRRHQNLPKTYPTANTFFTALKKRQEFPIIAGQGVSVKQRRNGKRSSRRKKPQMIKYSSEVWKALKAFLHIQTYRRR